MTPANRALATALLAAVTVLSSHGRAQEDSPRRLSAAEFDKLHKMLKRQPGESRWMQVVWYPTVWEARQKAAAEGKPLFLWAGSGGAPAAGC